MRRTAAIVGALLALSGPMTACQNLKGLPNGVSFEGKPIATTEVDFVADTTWIDQTGQRHVQQAIFDEVFRLIAAANKQIVLDMFLYNDFQGSPPEKTRALAGDLTRALIAKKLDRPNIDIVVITDPVNTLYGGLSSPYFERLEAAGIRVVTTNLYQLRDSNAVYSLFWRIFAKPFGNTIATTLPNPIGPGRVSLRSYLELANFKANHRKVFIADQGNDYVGFVSSANPHDGSSAHRNAAIRFTGAAVADLLASENAVLILSGQPPVEIDIPVNQEAFGPTIQVVTEGKIKHAILSRLDQASADDNVDIMMFYLSDRTIIGALKRAQARGVKLRILLDPNKDAFGREKNGIPNRPVAHELTRANIPVRWCQSQGEQCHTKMILIHSQHGNSAMISGSANLTRRNLTDFNLETDVVVEGPSSTPAISDASRYFEDAWLNLRNRQYSVAYEVYEDSSWWRRQLYLFMEWSGISTF